MLSESVLYAYLISERESQVVFYPFVVFVQVWDREQLECAMVLKGHTGSVLCLQYSEQVIVTGSSDSTIRSVCQHKLSLVCVCFPLLVATYVYVHIRTHMYMNSAHIHTLY